MAKKLDGLTIDNIELRVEELRRIFPEVFKDGKISFEELEAALGVYADDPKEKYGFTWKGKTDSLRLAGKRSTGTLRPCKDESKNWDTTQNLYIEGDNLEVLKLLQGGYLNSVKMIYIDPPYNTGNDFVYEDDFADNIQNYKTVTGQASRSNPETAGRYHTNWLNMMYPRLKIARTLLKDDGVIFISIDDNEQANLKKICDEVFGEDNFVATFPWRKRTAKSDVPFGVSQDYEWILAYAKTDAFVAAIEGGARKYYETPDFPGRPWRVHDLTTQRSAQERPNSNYTMVNPKNGDKFPVNPNRVWAVTKETFTQYYSEGKIVFPGDYDFLGGTQPQFRYFKDEDVAKAGESFGYIPVSTNLPAEVGMSQDGTKTLVDLLETKVFGFPKSVELIKHLIKTATNFDKNATILDFFSGSATTAHAVMQLNAEDSGRRKFILVQLPELTDETSEAYRAGYRNICEIGKERIRRAGEKVKSDSPLTTAGLDVGFKVFKLDTSNLKKWDNSYTSDIDELQRRITAHLDYLVPARGELDMVYEIIIKYNQPLTLDVAERDYLGAKAFIVTHPDYKLLICMAQDLTIEQMEAMSAEDVGTLFFADRCFEDANAMSNCEEILKKREQEMRLF
jgi:adenine-specific DNA-methyltransferase